MKPKHRHSLRDGFNKLLRARPGETGFCVTVVCETSRRLSTCHLGARPARLRRPLAHCTSDNALTSIASRLACRDDRDTPLLSRQDARTMPVIWGGSQVIYVNRHHNSFNQNRQLIPEPLSWVDRIASRNESLTYHSALRYGMVSQHLSLRSLQSCMDR
jgi:hypothetical protein